MNTEKTLCIDNWSAVVKVAVFSILAVGISACKKTPDSGSGDAEKVARKIEVVKVDNGTLKDVVEVPVSIEGYEMTSLVSKLEAYVGEVRVDIGDEVKKGDLLASLDMPEMLAERERRLKLITKSEKAWESARADSATAAAEVDQAKARLEEQDALLKLRQSELGRIKGLVTKRVMIEDKLNEAQYSLDSVLASISRIKADISAAEAGVRARAAQVESALADIDVSKAELKKTLAEGKYLEIRAPFNGLITERMVDPGALVRPAGEGGAPLFTIENVATMRAVMFVPISDAASIDKKDRVVLHSLQGHPEGMTIPSAEGSAPLTVSRFANSLNRGSRMMRVEVDLENPVDRRSGNRLLKPGGYGKASLSLNHYNDIDLVPESAVVKSDSGVHVVVVNEKNQSEFVPVTVMLTSKGRSGVVPIRGSLKGQRVIVSNPVEFEDGEDLSADNIVN